MSNFKAKVLLYPKRIQSFCESNLFSLRDSVLGCLFILSFQCHRIDRDWKEYREHTLRLHGRSEYATYKKITPSFYSSSTPPSLRM